MIVCIDHSSEHLVRHLKKNKILDDSSTVWSPVLGFNSCMMYVCM